MAMMRLEWAYILEPFKKAPKPPNIQSDSNCENTPNQPAFRPGEHRPESNTDAAQCHKKLSKWEVTERIIRVCELFAFIAVVLAMVYSRKQAIAAEGQVREMQHQRELDERAWIFIDVPDNSLTLQGTNYLLTAIAKNLGKTPGLVTGAYEAIAINTNQIPSKDYQVEGLKLMLIPNKIGMLPFPVQQNLIIAMNVIPVYVYGTVFYRDISGKKHWTQFCFSITDGGRKMMEMNFHSSCDDLEENIQN